jgi:hypothetical protein
MKLPSGRVERSRRKAAVSSHTMRYCVGICKVRSQMGIALRRRSGISISGYNCREIEIVTCPVFAKPK